jgi:hypothetical protein
LTSEDEQVYHNVIKHSPSPSLKKDRRSLEYLRQKVERQLYTLENILIFKRQSEAASLNSSPRHGGSFLAAANSHSPSRVDREVRHIIEALEKQRQLESNRTQGCALATLSQGRIPPSAPCLTVGSIYHKLYHRFLARRIIKQTQTIHNRRTFITLNVDETIEDDSTDDKWISETCVEKAHRILKPLGIEMSHTPLTWKEHQFIWNNPLGRYGCFRPSYLRWSWTAVEECGSVGFWKEE